MTAPQPTKVSVAGYSACVVPHPAWRTSSTGTRYGVVPAPRSGTGTAELGGAHVGAHWASSSTGTAATIERNVGMTRPYAGAASVEAIDPIRPPLPVLVDLHAQGEERSFGQLLA